MTFDFRNNRAPAIDVDGWMSKLETPDCTAGSVSQGLGAARLVLLTNGRAGTPGHTGHTAAGKSVAICSGGSHAALLGTGNWYQLRWYTSTTTCPAIHCKSIVDSCPAKLCRIRAHF